MDDNPLVSVIIPTFNRAHCLSDAIDSIVNQGIGSVEIIVVDDGSTDGTSEMLKNSGPNVRYLYQENQGPGTARNYGLREAKGTYIAFLDSDDVWLPHKLETELAFFVGDSDLDAIISDAEFWREGNLELPSRFAVSRMTPMPESPIVFRWESKGWAYGGGVCATCCMILKRSSLDKMPQPWFEPSITSYEDWYFEMLVYFHCRVLINPQIVAQVRRFKDETRSDRPSQGSRPFLLEQIMHANNQIVAIEKFLLLSPLTAYASDLAQNRRTELQELSRSLSADINQKITK
jgi:glycosyltransferase involved in cell wall biosynthesis